jgi:hypothetical protein
VEKRPIERLLDAIVLTALKKSAKFIAFDLDHVRLWIDGEWYEEMEPPPPLLDHLVRRLSVLIGMLAPAKGQAAIGRIELVAGDKHAYQLVRIERDDDARLRAIIELVDAAEFARRDQPQPPSQHPYRVRS